MLRMSAWLAIAFGALLAVAQTYRNWGNWGPWITWGVDVLGGLALMAAGVVALRRANPRSLPAAWGFAAGLYVSSVIGYSLRSRDLSPEQLAVHDARALIVTALMAVSLLGLISSLLLRPSGP